MIKTLAFDPGVTTGYAQGVIEQEGPMYITTGENSWTHGDVWRFIQEFAPAFLITERFDSRHTRYKQGVELYSRELIGIFNMYCEFNECKLILQQPMKGGKSAVVGFAGSNTTYFSDDRLKQDAIYKSGKGHANDAARHLLYWYWFGSGGQFDSRNRGYKSGLLS